MGLMGREVFGMRFEGMMASCLRYFGGAIQSRTRVNSEQRSKGCARTAGERLAFTMTMRFDARGESLGSALDRETRRGRARESDEGPGRSAEEAEQEGGFRSHDLGAGGGGVAEEMRSRAPCAWRCRVTIGWRRRGQRVRGSGRAGVEYAS
jgi:hypothetical protein